MMFFYSAIDSQLHTSPEHSNINMNALSMAYIYSDHRFETNSKTLFPIHLQL